MWNLMGHKTHWINETLSEAVCDLLYMAMSMREKKEKDIILDITVDFIDYCLCLHPVLYVMVFQ